MKLISHEIDRMINSEGSCLQSHFCQRYNWKLNIREENHC